MNTFAIGLAHVFLNNQLGDVAMENHEEVISRLKFIGHIQKDEKINVRHVNRQPNTLTTKIYRSVIYPDNRTNSLKFIKDVITRSFEIIEHYLHRGNILVCKSIVSDLIKARQGMLNLKYTYNDDTKFCCDMDVLIENIASRLTDLQSQTPTIFDEEVVEEKREEKKDERLREPREPREPREERVRDVINQSVNQNKHHK